MAVAYTPSEAKAYADAHLRGIWAAALQPFGTGGTLDTDGLAANLEHWIEDLKIDGFFIAGKQGEFYALSPDERRQVVERSVDVCGARAGTIISCSDPNPEIVVEQMRHAHAIGAPFVVVHAPILHFCREQDEILLEYYRHLSEQVPIAMALWSHEDAGYLMSPELCARLADIPTVVAIKYSVPRPMYSELTRMVGDRLIVSTASEDEWLDNILELGWKTYLCSSPPYLIQAKGDTRMRSYTDLALAGRTAEAKVVWDSLQSVRHALKSTRPPGKPHSHQKYWQSLLGQVGGTVRRPMLELTEAEKSATRAAFEACGLGTA